MGTELQEHETSESKTDLESEKIRPKGNKVLNILIFIGLMIFCTTPTAIAIGVVGLAFTKQNLLLVLVLILIGILWTGFVIWVVRGYYQRHTYEKPKQTFKPKDVGINLAYFLGIRVAVGLLSIVMSKVYSEDVTENDKAIMGVFDQVKDINFQVVLGIIVLFVVITFVAPYLEELTFRGIFKESLFSRHFFWLPLILSSVIFSINHASTNLIGFLMYALIGVLLYLAYQRRGNIKDSMMVHMLNNGVASTTLIIMIFM